MKVSAELWQTKIRNLFTSPYWGYPKITLEISKMFKESDFSGLPSCPVM
jgi:hypothetical protein